MGGFSGLGDLLGLGMQAFQQGFEEGRNAYTNQLMGSYGNQLAQVQLSQSRPLGILLQSQNLYARHYRSEGDVPSPEVEEVVVNSFLVGCDPEFVVFDAAGEGVNLSHKLPHAGQIGWDHSGYVAELRPQPAKGTFTLVKRLKELMMRADSLDLGNKWKAGAVSRLAGRTVTLGGHVHLDISPLKEGYVHETSVVRDPDNPEQVLVEETWTDEHKARVKALDTITARLEQLDILPNHESQTRRSSGDYGHYGDVRVQRHLKYDPAYRPSWHLHTEYRTMASWLYDPRNAFLCLTAAKLAAAEPQVALEHIKRTTIPWKQLVNWFELFKEKDVNARRLVDKVLSQGHKALVADPEVDFRERWKGKAQL